MQKLIGNIRKCFLYIRRPYWTADVYGFGKWIRKYGYYPNFLPLCIYTDHGPGDNGKSPYPHEIKSTAPVQFYHVTSAVERWRKISSKPCFPIYSPFVFARRSLRIEKRKESQGAIFFIAHSTPSISDYKLVDKYHKELQILPEKFKPITVCLHISDIEKGLDKKYRKLGYKVVTAGDSKNQEFTERFYRLLCSHKYALSNLFGSYGFYAVEMGIPFGLYGDPPIYINKNDSNIPIGVYESDKKSSYHRDINKLFYGLPADSISIEQHEFVKYHLGLDSGLSRLSMAKVLYVSLLKWPFSVFSSLVKKE